MRLSRFFGMHGNQYPIDRVRPIKGSFILAYVQMVLKTDLICCNVVFVRSFSLAVARTIRLASKARNSRKRSSPT